ncbi:MAG: hypothetical protein Q8T09_11695 [Candidatus Melainabacteria bacterium]|nr:hypothetical protein [Candidatus Melainabacteria bacterium]
MTHYPDLSTSCMVEEGPRVRAVGWLNPLFPFDTGPVSPELIAKLQEQCANPFQPLRLRGYHDCEFKLNGSTECKATGVKNLWIPGANGCLYVAPEMIIHYIQVHSYKPPEEFVQAALAAPAQKSPQYWQMMAPFGYSEPVVYGLALSAYESLSERDRQLRAQASRRTPEWEKANPVEAAIYRGMEQAEKGNFSEAAKELEIAVISRTKDQNLLFVFANACQKCGRFQDAINVSSDLIARNQEYPGTVTRGKDSLLVRALAFQGLHDYTNAKADFSVVVDRDESCAAAYVGLSQCSAAQGLTAEAAAYLEQARKLSE